MLDLSWGTTDWVTFFFGMFAFWFILLIATSRR